MRKPFSRPLALLLIPLVLGALIGGAKWKQLHPTPTQFDLQERALLSKAAKVGIWNPTHRGQVPVDEFKETLDEFYLIEDDGSDVTPPDQIVFMVMLHSSDDASKSVAMIGVSPLGYYVLRDTDSQRPLSVRSLHPVTRRRLEKLIEENISIN